MNQQIPPGFGLYDVKGAKNNPLVISHEHAQEINDADNKITATAHESAADAAPTTVKAILAAVGDDPEKAAAALEAEQAKGDKARESLVKQLELIAATPADG